MTNNYITRETAYQDFLDNVFIDIEETEEERLRYHGRCQECDKPNTGLNWCQSCDAAHFRTDFDKWTLGNAEIDYFIQHAQIHARDYRLVLEWYPWEAFSEIEQIGQGGYGTVFKAITNLGRIWYRDNENNEWSRYQSDYDYVVLKTIGDSEILSKDFLNEAKRLQRWAYQSDFTTLYGFTKNETTGQYHLVLRYFENGDLRNQLRHEQMTWEKKIREIYYIAGHMNLIHATGMIHRDLHPGNILYSAYPYIGDLGLSILQKEASEIEDIVGVMPYLAPELLVGGKYSQAADVYAFGIIMWEITSEENPFSHTPHDKQLALRICKGLRPKITKDTPQFYRDLMEKCWNADPTKRPTAEEIAIVTRNWDDLSFCTPEIQAQVKKAEEIRPTVKKEVTSQHPGAIYTSRLLTNIAKELASINLDNIEIPEED